MVTPNEVEETGMDRLQWSANIIAIRVSYFM